jgi:hypothetical protein
MMAMAMEPEDRFQSVADLKAALLLSHGDSSDFKVADKLEDKKKVYAKARKKGFYKKILLGIASVSLLFLIVVYFLIPTNNNINNFNNESSHVVKNNFCDCYEDLNYRVNKMRSEIAASSLYSKDKIVCDKLKNSLRNEEAVQAAFNLFVETGYNGDIDKFKNLISTNSNALEGAHKLFVETGYNGDIDKFKVLIGAYSPICKFRNNKLIKDLYLRAKELGYKKDEKKFEILLYGDQEVYNDMYKYAESKGITKNKFGFSILIGKFEKDNISLNTLQAAYTLFSETGYDGDFDKFKNLIVTNPEALQEAHRLFEVEAYLMELYEYIKEEDNTYASRYDYNKYKRKMQDEEYAIKIYEWICDKDNSFKQELSLHAFLADVTI